MSTQNTYSTSSTSKASHFKIYSALAYLLVIALSSLSCFGFCRFVINKEVDSDISTTRILSNSVLMTEYYMDSNLKCATTAMSLYLQNHSFPTKREDLWKLRDDVLGSSGNLSIFNGKTGKLTYQTSANLWKNPEYWAKRKTFSFGDNEKEMLKEDDATVYYPIRNQDGSKAGVLSYNSKSATRWIKSGGNFLHASFHLDDFGEKMHQFVSTNDNIENIIISTGSGVVVTDASQHSDYSRKNLPITFDVYSEKPVVNSSMSAITVSIPFGGFQNNSGALKADTGTNSGQANNAGQYFYVMNVTFNKAELNKQLATIIVGFIVFTLFVCIAIYYINAYSAKSSELAALSERTADKVTHLCNARLGEVRRYVTKIVKDSMRVDNMNKELPEEMVQLLNRAFREVDEKGLIEANKEDVQ